MEDMFCRSLQSGVPHNDPAIERATQIACATFFLNRIGVIISSYFVHQVRQFIKVAPLCVTGARESRGPFHRAFMQGYV